MPFLIDFVSQKHDRKYNNVLTRASRSMQEFSVLILKLSECDEIAALKASNTLVSLCHQATSIFLCENEREVISTHSEKAVVGF